MTCNAMWCHHFFAAEKGLASSGVRQRQLPWKEVGGEGPENPALGLPLISMAIKGFRGGIMSHDATSLDLPQSNPAFLLHGDRAVALL